MNLDLTIVVTDADGNTKTLGSDEPHPGDRPSGITFSSQAGSGFYTAAFSLSRPIDRENTDLHLLDDVKIVGANGDVAWEGYIVEMPRSMDDTHTLSVSCAGWMGHAADEPFTEIFVDRDLGRWGGAGNARRVAILGSGLFGSVADPTVITDEAGAAALRAAVSGAWAANQGPVCDAWYDAGPGNTIGQLAYAWTRGASLPAGPDAWAWNAGLASDDAAASFDITADLQAAGPGSGTLSATTADRRYAFLTLLNGPAAGGVAGTEYPLNWHDLAVRGNHGLPLIGTAPYGVTASDVIRYLAGRYCPLLSTRGVQDTTYPIEQLAFYEDTSVYDAWLRLNAYHLWQLAVWENRTLHYGPADLTDWDWEIRHDEAGSKIGLQGDSIENRRAGIIVTYTNVATGQVGRLHPDDHAELLDGDIENPWISHGRRGYETYQIPFPTTEADALELGRVKLAESNQASAPGQFTVQSRVRDRAGNWQPAWMMRSGQTVRLTSSATLSDRPRLIGEANYSHDGATATITVDSTARYLDAYLDRMATALAAANL